MEPSEHSERIILPSEVYLAIFTLTLSPVLRSLTLQILLQGKLQVTICNLPSMSQVRMVLSSEQVMMIFFSIGWNCPALAYMTWPVVYNISLIYISPFMHWTSSFPSLLYTLGCFPPTISKFALLTEYERSFIVHPSIGYNILKLFMVLFIPQKSHNLTYWS